jgi:hypothetical protein
VIKSGRIRLVVHVARMGERRSANTVFVGDPKGKETTLKPRRRWEDNIRMDLQETE